MKVSIRPADTTVIPCPKAITNWIDLEYLYADGTGVAGAAYVVQISNGLRVGGSVLAQGILDSKEQVKLQRKQVKAEPGQISGEITNWGIGPVRPSARPLLKNEGVLINASHGLQSSKAGLFRDDSMEMRRPSIFGRSIAVV